MCTLKFKKHCLKQWSPTSGPMRSERLATASLKVCGAEKKKGGYLTEENAKQNYAKAVLGF